MKLLKDPSAKKGDGAQTKQRRMDKGFVTPMCLPRYTSYFSNIYAFQMVGQRKRVEVSENIHISSTPFYIWRKKQHL